ncbi:MAG TPA: hypothetical protein DD670_12160, partial [Planctomycetaceae bacterium]|nr:hypothetical protein [Planctomycetaceae bacterium]
MSESSMKKRWFVVLGAVLVQLCLGAIYAWGVFTPALQATKTELVALLSPKLLQLPAERTEEIAAVKAKIKELEERRDHGVADPSEATAEMSEMAAELARLCATTVDEVPEEVWAKHHFEFSGKKTSAIFSAGLFSFAFVMILAGRWQDKVGPRWVAMVGG